VSDVHGLAAVCFGALTGIAPYGDTDPMVARSLGPLAPGVPASLVAAIEAGLDPEPATRPDAAAFGRALFASCSPVAVRLARASQRVGGTTAANTQVTAGSERAVEVSPAADSPGVSRFRRAGPVRRHCWSAGRRVLVSRLVAAACVVALLSAAVAIGIAWGWADHGHRASASSAVPAILASSLAAWPTAATADPAPPIASPPDWPAVLGALDSSRADAFADADANELDAIYVPASAALATDRATLGRLVGAGQRVRGLQFMLASVRVVSQSSDEVTLAVVDTLAGYDVIDAGGATTHVSGRGVRNWTVVLRAQPPCGPSDQGVAVEARWRIASVAPA
jgi:eukaryotic-like serine/threonine-protein kinase